MNVNVSSLLTYKATIKLDALKVLFSMSMYPYISQKGFHTLRSGHHDGIYINFTSSLYFVCNKSLIHHGFYYTK